MKFRKEIIGSTKATLILSVLNSGSAHGHEIVFRINELSDGVLKWQEETICPTLSKLESNELIQGRWVAASNGKMRCIYSLTEDGRRALISKAKKWTTYSKAVECVLEASYA
jgi:PadR family transcriptional regulator PadR